MVSPPPLSLSLSLSLYLNIYICNFLIYKLVVIFLIFRPCCHSVNDNELIDLFLLISLAEYNL